MLEMNTKPAPDVGGLFADVLHAYIEASGEVQKIVKRFVEVYESAESDDDDRLYASEAIKDLLFPEGHDFDPGVDVEDFAPGAEARAVEAAMAEQEETFAGRVKSEMDRQNLTQAALAKRIGVRQPAVSMMLSRQCRPQKVTIDKVASALNVKPEKLWPDLAATPPRRGGAASGAGSRGRGSH